jgi:hypothetical protein
MTSKQPTITGELRKWRLLVKPDVMKQGIVMGKMYNDVNDIWEDGEDAVIHISQWIESSNFYLAVTHHSAIKCPKDEEKPGGTNSP